MKNILILILSIAITGCSTWNKPVYMPLPVNAPIANVPEKPDLPIYHLNKNSSYSEVTKAYVASFYRLRMHDDAVSLILDGYRADDSNE